MEKDAKLKIIDAGGLKVLVRLASPRNPGPAVVAEAAARTLWNLATNDKAKAAIAEAGGVEVLVLLAGKGDTVGCKEAAAGALRNLAVDKACQIQIARAGAIPPLIELLKDGGSARCPTPRTAGAVAAGAESAARCLWNLAFRNKENQEAITQYGAVEALVDLCACAGSVSCKEAAAGALRNLIHGNDACVDAMLASGAVGVFLDMDHVSAKCFAHAVALLKHLAAHEASKSAVASALRLEERDATPEVLDAAIDARFREEVVAEADL